MEGLTLFETESFVRGLASFGLAEVGSDAWMAQHGRIQRLNAQAHIEAQGKHDEYVVDQFVSQGKVEVLVHELLVIEAWKAKVLPLLLDHFSALTAVKAYMVLYHEVTLCSLLEVLMYHASVCEVGGESMLELGDFCVRKVTALTTGQFKALQADEPDDPKSSLDRDTKSTVLRQHLDIGFAVAVCAVTMLRFLSDHVDVLALGVTTRLLQTHDVLLSLVPLIESPPWTRRRNGKYEKFFNQQWQVVAPQNLLMLTTLEGQVWLCVYNLIMDKSCRKQYTYNTHRKEVLVRLKRFFTDVLLDQLPLLRELKRFIEELAIMEPPPPTASSMAIIEQVPEMREAILNGVDFVQLAAAAKRTVFSNDERARQRDIARLAQTYNLESLEDSLPPPTCGACGKTTDAMKRCSRCKNEWYCSRVCQVQSWKNHQKVCDLMANDAKKTAAAATGSATKTEAKPKTATKTTTATETAAKPAPKPTPAAKPATPSAPVVAAPAPAAAKPTPSPATAAPTASATTADVAAPACGSCNAADAPKRCSRCKQVWYCDRTCQVSAWPRHQKACDAAVAAAASSSNTTTSATNSSTTTTTPAATPITPATMAANAIKNTTPAAAAKPAPATPSKPEPVAAASVASPSRAFASGKIVLLDEDEEEETPAVAAVEEAHVSPLDQMD